MIAGKGRRDKRRDAGGGRLAFWVVSLFFLAFLFSAWQVWFYLYTLNPRFESLLINVNEELREILPGEVVTLHPKDIVKIEKVSTNVPFNYGVRLLADHFDVSALQYEPLKLSSLLPNRKAFDEYRFRIEIKFRNAKLGTLDWEVRPFVEDWLEKADRTINPDRRTALLENAVKLMPDEERLRRRLIDEYKNSKKWRQAASLLEAGKPERVTLEELMEIYTTMGAREQTLSTLKRMVDLDPEDTKSRRRLAEMLEKEGESAQAAEEYEVLLTRMEEKNKLPLYKHLGYLYTQSGQYEKAVTSYLAASKLDQSDANLYYNLATLYEQLHQKDKAEFYLQNAVTLKSEDMESRLRLAQGAIEKGEFEKGERYLKEVLEKRPESLHALQLLMQVYEKQEDRGKLKETYGRVLAVDPGNETVIYNLGALELEMGNLQEAVSYFRKYLSLHPDDQALHGILFDAYRQLGNGPEAYKEAEVLMESTPKDLDPYRYAFGYLKSKDDYEGIVRIMERGLRANPAPEIREYLIVAYLKTGRDEQAAAQMEEVLRARPDDAGLLLDLARLREKQGRYEEALRGYKRAMDLSPGQQEAEDAYLRLRLEGVQDAGPEQ